MTNICKFCICSTEQNCQDDEEVAGNRQEACDHIAQYVLQDCLDDENLGDDDDDDNHIAQYVPQDRLDDEN